MAQQVRPPDQPRQWSSEEAQASFARDLGSSPGGGSPWSPPKILKKSSKSEKIQVLTFLWLVYWSCGQFIVRSVQFIVRFVQFIVRGASGSVLRWPPTLPCGVSVVICFRFLAGGGVRTAVLRSQVWRLALSRMGTVL